MPQINWLLGMSKAPEGHYTHRFVNSTQDLFLHQHVLEPTRFRQGERAHTLDLIFSNEVGMVKNMQYCPGLGNSDHVIIRFDLACYTVRHESKDPRLDFNSADFAKLNDLINRTDWSMTTDPTLGMEERYTAFKTTLNTLVERCVPTAKPKSKKKICTSTELR